MREVQGPMQNPQEDPREQIQHPAVVSVDVPKGATATIGNGSGRSTVVALTTEPAELFKRLGTANAQIEEQRAQLEANAATFEALNLMTAARDKWRAMAEKWEAENTDLRVELQKVTEDRDDLQGERNRFVTGHDNWRMIAENLATTNNRLCRLLDVPNNDLETLELVLTAKVQSHRFLESENEKLIADRDSWKRTAESVGAINNELQAEELDAANSALQVERDALEKEVAYLKKQVSSATIEGDGWRRAAEKWQAENDALKERVPASAPYRWKGNMVVATVGFHQVCVAFVNGTDAHIHGTNGIFRHVTEIPLSTVDEARAIIEATFAAKGCEIAKEEA